MKPIGSTKLQLLFASLAVVAGCGSAGEAGEQAIAFLSDRTGDYEIFVTVPGTDSVVNLTRDPGMDYGLSWSPDGQRIAFGSNRDGNRDIHVMDADGANVQNLTAHPAADASPAWSPDGARIAFVSNRDAQSREIYVMDADGSNVVRVTNNERYEEVPAWSPDGRRIAFVRGTWPEAAVFLADPDGSAPRRLTPMIPGAREPNR